MNKKTKLNPRVKSPADAAGGSSKTKLSKQQRNNIQKKVIKRSLGSGLGKQTNEYLQTILNPEKYRGVRVPDGFPRETAMVDGLINTYLPYFPTTSTRERPGSYYAIVRPSVVHPIWVYGKSHDFAGTQPQWFSLQQGRYGITSLSDTRPNLSVETGCAILQSGVPVNIKAALCYSQVDYPQEPFKAYTPDGNVFYGNAVSGFTTATNRIAYARVVIDGMGIAIGDTIKFDWVDANGNTATATATATAVGQQVFESGPVTVNTLIPLDSDPDVGCASGRPGIGVRLTLTMANPLNQNLISTHGRYTGTQAVARYGLYPVDLPIMAEAIKDIDLYRIVSMSAWTEYQGATLTDGGQLAGLLYKGGDHPNDLGFWQYENVADVPGSYQGKERDGNYTIWFPTNVRDTMMRDLVTPHDWNHPYIVISGIVSSPDIPNTLRLRVPMNIELVSANQIFQRAMGPRRPEWISHAADVLKDFPASMENQNHLSEIKDALRRGLNMASGVGNWLSQNSGWLMPAIGTAASLL